MLIRFIACASCYLLHYTCFVQYAGQYAAFFLEPAVPRAESKRCVPPAEHQPNDEQTQQRMGHESAMHRSSFETSFRLKSMESDGIALGLNRTHTITHHAESPFNQVVGKHSVHQGIIRPVMEQCIPRKASDLRPVVHLGDGQKRG